MISSAMQGLASHWDLVRMHFMVWRPRARAAARARWYTTVDGAVTASVAQAAQRAAVVRVVAAPVAPAGGVAPAGKAPTAVLLSRAPAPPLSAAGTPAAAVRSPVSQPPREPASVADPSPRPVFTAAPEGKPAAQGQARLVSIVARATGSWRGPRPSLASPPPQPGLPLQLELQRSSSSPLTSQLRARFEGLAAIVAPADDGANAETAARRKALGGFSRRRLQVSSPLQAPRGVAVH